MGNGHDFWARAERALPIKKIGGTGKTGKQLPIKEISGTGMPYQAMGI